MNKLTVDELAAILHEAGREAVTKGLTAPGRELRPFIEWLDTDEATKEGRRIQARYLLQRYELVPLEQCIPAQTARTLLPGEKFCSDEPKTS